MAHLKVKLGLTLDKEGFRRDRLLRSYVEGTIHVFLFDLAEVKAIR